MRRWHSAVIPKNIAATLTFIAIKGAQTVFLMTDDVVKELHDVVQNSSRDGDIRSKQTCGGDEAEATSIGEMAC